MTIYLIRHGEAAKAWDEDPDPGLSAKGQQQATDLAIEYIPRLVKADFQIISSPLLRAQETALPFQKRLNKTPIINPNFAEIPSPGVPLSKRRTWLKSIFQKEIRQLEKPQLDWRNTIIQSLHDLDKNTLIFSHFMVINGVVGWLRQADKLVSYYPNYCSVMKIEKVAGKFFLKELGEELSTVVQ